MQIVFVRWSGGTNRVSGIHLVGADGAGERELIRLQGQRVMHPRWSLDGEKIAASINERGMPQRIVLVSVADGGIRLLDPPSYRPPISSVVFARDNNSLVYLQADSVTATLGSSPAQLIRQNTRTGRWKSVLLTQTHGNMVDLLPDGRVLLDARSPRANLREVALEQPSPAAAAGKSLTVGNSADRQPVYSPDGELIAFSSNRGGNLDIWTLSRKTGIVRRLTDHPAEDWDPAFSPDGKRLLWSSNRSGKFQIWMANVDGTAPRQVTHNDHDSENPAMSAHGGWIVYVLRTSGIWKVRPDGTDAKQLTSSGWLWIPEISPDGKYVAYFEEPEPMLRVIRAVEVESGELVPFEIRLHIQKPTPALIGRLRWMPDGTKIVFLGQDDRGLNGVFVQDFTPGMDTTATRRPLAGFESDSSAESFAISPDGLRLTIASWERNSSIGVAETVP